MKQIIIILIVALLAIIGLFFVSSTFREVEIVVDPKLELAELSKKGIFKEIVIKENEAVLDFEVNVEEKKRFFDAPEIVRAIYLTEWSAATGWRVQQAIELASSTEMNTIVVDIKDWSGFIIYDTNVPEADEYGAERILIPEIGAFLESLHQQDIYVIGRIAVFQDPILAQARPDLAIQSKSATSSVWLDNSGLEWIDPSAKEAWDYNIAIAKDALEQGFDEINFDYIRFPSDGDLKDMEFLFYNATTTRHLAIKEFFQYLRNKLPKAVLSADLFGLTTVNFDDIGIGQIIEHSFEYFDYVCPMVYPSHYADGFLGYKNPNDYPYEIVKYSMDSAIERLIKFNQSKEVLLKAKLRPWLQDFVLSGDVFNAEMVKAQIRATQDALGNDFHGFMLWNSRNIYSEEVFK